MCACDTCTMQGEFGCPQNNVMGGGIGVLGEFGGFVDFTPDSDTSQETKKKKLIKEAIERHAPDKVIGGLIVAGREDYTSNRFILTVEEAIDEDGFDGMKLHEAYIEAASADGVLRFSEGFYVGRPVIINAKTGKLLESMWVTI